MTSIQLDHIAMVRKRPELFVGNFILEEKKLRVINLQEGKFEIKPIIVSEGLEKLFFETLNNAVDNVFISIHEGIDPGDIKVRMNRKVVEVTNSGYFFPVTQNEEGIYNQTIALSSMFSGTH